MSVNSIVSSLQEFRINLYPEDLELLMGLKKGLLSQEVNKKSKVIKFDGKKQVYILVLKLKAGTNDLNINLVKSFFNKSFTCFQCKKEY